MKKLTLLAALVFGVLTLNAAPPALKAPEAAAIAQGDLDSRGVTDVYIAEIRFKAAGLLGGDPAHWEVMWSKELPAQTEGRKEIGLKIKMDGSYVRAVR